MENTLSSCFLVTRCMLFFPFPPFQHVESQMNTKFKSNRTNFYESPVRVPLFKWNRNDNYIVLFTTGACSLYGYLCQNNANCVNDGTTDPASPGFTCVCVSGYTGAYCGRYSYGLFSGKNQCHLTLQYNCTLLYFISTWELSFALRRIMHWGLQEE